jgi:hypothetical protein
MQTARFPRVTEARVEALLIYFHCHHFPHEFWKNMSDEDDYNNNERGRLDR